MFAKIINTRTKDIHATNLHVLHRVNGYSSHTYISQHPGVVRVVPVNYDENVQCRIQNDADDETRMVTNGNKSWINMFMNDVINK